MRVTHAFLFYCGARRSVSVGPRGWDGEGLCRRRRRRPARVRVVVGCVVSYAPMGAGRTVGRACDVWACTVGISSLSLHLI